MWIKALQRGLFSCIILVYRPTHTIIMSDTSATESNKTATAPLKVKRIVPTIRQRRTAKIMVDALQNGTEYTTAAEIMKTAGYGTGLQLQPSRVLDSVGTKEALKELGFTEENAKNVVYRILNSDNSKDSDRLKAADMVFKVHGTYAAEKHVSLNVDANIDTQAMLELAERLRNTAR